MNDLHWIALVIVSIILASRKNLLSKPTKEEIDYAEKYLSEHKES